MKDNLDLHTHTIASGHAYNTINEMIEAASRRGLSVYGITEHAPAMAGSCTLMYFMNLKALPRERSGMTVLYGAELNILDFDGHVDMPDRTLAEMDITVASMHTPCFKGGTAAENTRAYLNVMKHPYINVIGHPDDGRYPVDYKALVEGAREYNVLLEVNNSSLSPNSFRDHARENYLKMLEYCKEFETPVVMDSDAHVDLDVGNHTLVLEVLKEADFPEDLVANAHPEILKKYANYYKR
ncbi:MAG: phosphatase [Lachnospiraceae bacterium]|nr:phosphatase [Lachnospiraceae bacterium]